jgi:hypothetical protein
VHAPDFSALALLPSEGCNSPTAQFIAQGLCLGQPNCTLKVLPSQRHRLARRLDPASGAASAEASSGGGGGGGGGGSGGGGDGEGRSVWQANFSYSWEVLARSPCPPEATFSPRFRNDTSAGLCEARLDPLVATANYSACPLEQEGPGGRRLLVRGTCAAPAFTGVSWINGGGESFRSSWARALSWLDALVTTCVFAVRGKGVPLPQTHRPLHTYAPVISWNMDVATEH